MLWPKSLCLIILSDIDLACIFNFIFMFHTRSHKNDHLCFNLFINDDLMAHIHIFIFLSELLPLCVTLTFDAETYILQKTLRPTKVNIGAQLL
jgi:hypothetical protein